MFETIICSSEPFQLWTRASHSSATNGFSPTGCWTRYPLPPAVATDPDHIHGTGGGETSTLNDIDRKLYQVQRSAPSMVFDAHRGVTLLFGGKRSGRNWSDIWSWDGATYTDSNQVTRAVWQPETADGWDSLMLAGQWPAPRYANAEAYNSDDHTVLMYGGWRWITQNDAGTATYSGETWQLVPYLPPCKGCSSDFNQDGDSGTDADIEAFFACLAGNCCANCLSGDFNCDGDTGTDADIEAFFRVLAGGKC